ncbi:MAG: ShlB/FhaC/HecB family hemolysin secretion/activation protein [Candidatus Sedimenticola sp. PURPLELP]
MECAKLAKAIGLLAVSCTVCAEAETEMEQQGNRILQEHQQRLEEQRRRIESEQKRHQPIIAVPPKEEPSVPGGPCFDVKEIEFDGATLLPDDEAVRIQAPYLARCVDLASINQLIRKVTDWYLENGYITSRAYVTAQDLSSGSLAITVIEGSVESIEPIDAESRINVHTAFPSVTGDILNLRDIEQGLEQINRLRSYDVKMDLLPGAEPGGSVISINSQESEPVAVSLSRDNSGQKSTGELMNGLMISLDNPLGLNDYSYFQLQKDTLPRRYGKSSRSVTGHWDMPYGYWNFGLDFSHFEYLTTVQGNLKEFETSGESTNKKISLSRTLFRDESSKLKIKAGLSHKRMQNHIEDVILDNSRALTVGTIGFGYEKYFPGQAQLQIDVNYHRGLKLFNALKDTEDENGEPRAQFDKLTARLDYTKAFKVVTAGKPLGLTWQSTLQAQYSDDLLFGSEQISIGSLYSVRGYKGTSVSAASGAYWRNTLTLQFKPEVSWLEKVEPFVAIDVGAVRDRANVYAQGKYVDLSGLAAGIKLSGKHFSADMTYARPNDPPDWLQADSSQWYFTLTYKF